MKESGNEESQPCSADSAETRIDHLNRKAADSVESEPDRCSEIAREALEQARRNSYRAGEAASLFCLGEASRKKENYSKALHRYAEALEIFSSLADSVQKARCLRRMGDIHYFVNNLDIAMRHYLEALRIFQDDRLSSTQPYCRLQAGHLMATIGNVLRESGDLEDALNYYRRCSEIYTSEDFSKGIPGILYNMGNVYLSQGFEEKALSTYRTVLQSALDSNDSYLETLAHNSIGSVLMPAGNLVEAEAHFRKSLDVSSRLDRKRGILSSLIKLTELERLKGCPDMALETSSKAEELSGYLSDRRSLSEVLYERTLIFRDMDRHEEALEMSLSCRSIDEELHSEKRTREIDLLRIRYETEAREMKIERLNRERTIQRKMIAGAFAGLALVTVTLASVYRNMRFRVRLNSKLENRNKALAEVCSRVERLSRTDPLTELANRRAMMELLSSEQARFNRTGRGYALIIGDIDGFKAVNDSYGHTCGDEVLKQVSSRISNVLREHDTVSRWGGEEFLFLLPETSAEGAFRAAEKARTAVSRREFIWKGKSIPLTMTFGISEGGELPVDKAIQQSDRALYRGKRNGKNQVSVCLK